MICRSFILISWRDYFFAVLILNGKYSGQTAKTLVSKNTAAKITRTSPHVPVTVPVKYRTAPTAARISLMIRSVVPIFFSSFILCLHKFFQDRFSITTSSRVTKPRHRTQTASNFKTVLMFFCIRFNNSIWLVIYPLDVKK